MFPSAFVLLIFANSIKSLAIVADIQYLSFLLLFLNLFAVVSLLLE